MKIEDKHTWSKQSDSDYSKVWTCDKCGCEKRLGNYKFETPMYIRSGHIIDYRPDCVDMNRRSDDILD